MKVVPELYVQSIDDNLAFFVDILGFNIKYQRKEEQFVYLTREGLDLMLEGVEGNSRKWLAGKPESEKMITKVCRNCGYGDTRLGKAWSSRNICPNCRKTGSLRIKR